jgi:hypothetical protein
MTDAGNLALNRALDRFDVPPMSAGLADRIAAATAAPPAPGFGAPRRDRRGMWRRGRQIVLGSLAVGLLSAGAVASGLLGSVGIEVPVLTAMLAPKPKPVVKAVHLAPKEPITRTATVAPPVMITDPVQAGIARPMLPAERLAVREERRERRQVFAAEHPVAAAMIRERVRERLQERALARRQALMVPGVDPSMAGARPLDLADRAALARAARRDRLVAEKMIDRRILAREARIAEKQDGSVASPTVPVAANGPPSVVAGNAQPGPAANRFQQLTPEQREARRARFQQLPPEQRAMIRERLQQRRAGRLGRQPQN